jgi:hypothetical protein
LQTFEGAMGEIAEAMLDGLLDEETGELIDGTAPGYPRRVSDRREERRFKRQAPAKTCSCIAPGCAKKFRPSTAYQDFLTHWQAKHASAKSKDPS